MPTNLPIETIIEILDDATNSKIPIENVRESWTCVGNELVARGLNSTNSLIGAIATIGVETGSFRPVKERGGSAYLSKLYWQDEHRRRMLGNVQESDAWMFRGRGFVQISGRTNYTNYGHALGIDLVANPDLALDPQISAKIFALYWRDHKIQELADAENWEKVRRAVNGGLNGWSEFLDIVGGLKAAIGQPIEVVKANAANA